MIHCRIDRLRHYRRFLSPVFQEFARFFRRYGVAAVLSHTIEVYLGALLRWLPGVEGLFLRELLSRRLLKKAGSKLIIYPHVYMVFLREISLGDRAVINTGCYIDGRGGIVLGDNVMIGPHCVLVSYEHGHSRVDIPMYEQDLVYLPIRIGDDVWLGAHVCVTGGVEIGSGCIIGAGSVVTRDIPPYSIAAGIPARVISSRRPGDKLATADQVFHASPP